MSRRFEDFDEFLEACKENENYQLEYKSTKFIDYAHHYNKGQTKEDFRNALKALLGKECGAFANSSGGSLAFGIDDQTSRLDSIPVPTTYGKQSIEAWVRTMLIESLQPKLENFNPPYLLCCEDGSKRVLIIDIPVSDKAPHQAVFDKRYYVRRSDTSEMAEHWIIEDIRNRKTHPAIEANYISDNAQVRTVNFAPDFMGIMVCLKIKNIGKIIAKDWALKLSSSFSDYITIADKNNFERNHLPSTIDSKENLYRSRVPLYPTQEIEILVQMNARSSLEYSLDAIQKLKWRGIADSLMDRFQLEISLYADSASPCIKAINIPVVDFMDSAHDLLETYGRIHVKRNFCYWDLNRASSR